MRARRLDLTCQALRERPFILCLDETGDRKKGKTTDYAAHQHIGNVHTLANGVVSVNAYGVLDTLTLPLAFRLYKPQRRLKPTRAPSHPMHATQLVRGNTALAPDLAPMLEPEVEARPEPRPIEDIVIPMSERVTIMELREQMCRWPLGDPGRDDFRFCGGRIAPGGPYCTHHAQIAYQPVLDRRRDRERRAMRA